MLRATKIIPIFLFLVAQTMIIQAQESKFSYDGNIRIAHLGKDSEPNGWGGDNTSIRIRIGGRYQINNNSVFRVRLAGAKSVNQETLHFTILNDGRRMKYGGVSFDEFYYRFKTGKTQVTLGRFQKSMPVLTNAKRSNFRFQSNVNFIHWSDGVYIKHGLKDGWFTEFVGEYQPKDHLTYSYAGNLDFQNNDHNMTAYFGVENQERDQYNLIQKGFAIFAAPGAYNKNGEYSTYFAFMGRLAYDLPKPDLLKGGSFRVGAEFGQNLSSSFDEGTNLAISAGVNKVAGKHEFMAELARTDAQWLTATVFAPNADELELRYRYFITKKFNVDVRYRIRDPRTDEIPVVYSTFLRTTFSF